VPITELQFYTPLVSREDAGMNPLFLHRRQR